MRLNTPQKEDNSTSNSEQIYPKRRINLPQRRFINNGLRFIFEALTLLLIKNLNL